MNKKQSKKLKKSPKKNFLFQSFGLGTILLTAFSMFSSGFSSWVINNYDSSASATIEVNGAEVKDLSDYIGEVSGKNNSLTKYNSYGFLYDNEFVYSCNARVYWAFDVKSFSADYSTLSVSKINFTLDLSYDESKDSSSYTFISHFSGASIYSASLDSVPTSYKFTPISLDMMTPSTSISFAVEKTYSELTNNYFYIFVDYYFNAESKSEFDKMYSNELSGSVSSFLKSSMNAEIIL